MADRQRFHRRIIRITAENSPNVVLARREIAAGLEPSNTIVVPGVLSWQEYQKRLATWDIVRQEVGLFARFYLGSQLLLYPPDWLDHSAHLHEELLRSGKKRIAKAIGIDPAEGGDRTAMAVGDEFGLIELTSKKTPKTDDIPNEAITFMKRHGVPPEMVMIDSGGGGKQHVDRLRVWGYPVRAVSFAEPVSPVIKSGMSTIMERTDEREDRVAYFNRRAEMYGEFSILMDPSGVGGTILPNSVSKSHVHHGYALPSDRYGPQYAELRRQLGPLPKTYVEGKLRLIPKSKIGKTGLGTQTLMELLGCSPDESDAVALMTYGLLHQKRRSTAGVA